jgi:hypothetical protein
LVAEDAQVGDLAGEAGGVGFGVGAHGADEDDEAGADLGYGRAVDGDAGFGGALDEGAHRSHPGAGGVRIGLQVVEGKLERAMRFELTTLTLAR